MVIFISRFDSRGFYFDESCSWVDDGLFTEIDEFSILSTRPVAFSCVFRLVYVLFSFLSLGLTLFSLLRFIKYYNLFLFDQIFNFFVDAFLRVHCVTSWGADIAIRSNGSVVSAIFGSMATG